MTLQFLRTLTTLLLKHEPSNLTNLSNFSLLSTLVTQIETSTLEITDYLKSRHNLSHESASKTAKFLAHFKGYKKSDFVLDFLRKKGFSSTQLGELVVSQPRVLVADPNKRIRLIFEKISDLGFSDDELVNLVCDNPVILTLSRSDNAIVSAITTLQRIMGSNADVIKLLKASVWFLYRDLNKNLLPNIELLKECGVNKVQLRQNLFSFPRLFLHKPEVLKELVRRVDEMGLVRDSKMFIHGVRVLSSMTLENWETKLKLFKSLGFSDDDILFVFRKVPNVFAVSGRKILEVSKLLLSSERVDTSYLVKHAELLVFSATSRIRPRMDIINALLSKNLIKKEPSMTTMCKIDEKSFIHRYVLPYLGEIGEVGENYLARKGFKGP